jgi:hypothetical protein
MAIKDIVTRGYGPSEVKFVPTRGYIASSTPPVVAVTNAAMLPHMGVGN